MVDPYFTMLWSHAIPEHVFQDASGRATRVVTVAGALDGKATPPPPPSSWAARADAGIGTGGRSTDVPLDSLCALVDTNFTGLYLSAREGAKRMIAAGSIGGFGTNTRRLGRGLVAADTTDVRGPAAPERLKLSTA